MKKLILITAFLLLTACSITQIVEQTRLPDGEVGEPLDEQSAVNRQETGIPLDRPSERITKKPFGIKITPDNSPVQPEKFSGYHTGVDFEIFEGEEDADVNVYAICDGELLVKKYVNGYGGTAIQRCAYERNDITVLYGHLKLNSIGLEVNQVVYEGQKIGILGKGGSDETDGERKHLHLGVHKGRNINYLGYVQDQLELGDWINPLMLIPELAWASSEDRTGD